MSKLYIAEFSGVALTASDGAAIAPMPAINEQVVDFTAGATASAAFNAATRIVRIHTDAICSLAFGPTPVATVANARLIAGQTEYFGVVPGQKVSAIVNI